MMVIGDPFALLVITIEPVALPAWVGAKFTPSVALPEGSSVAGAVSPVKVNPAPLEVILEICTGAFPVLVIATCCVELAPTPTLPKLRLVELAVN